MLFLLIMYYYRAIIGLTPVCSSVNPQDKKRKHSHGVYPVGNCRDLFPASFLLSSVSLHDEEVGKLQLGF